MFRTLPLLLILSFLFLSTIAVADGGPFFQKADDFFTKYVKEGKVNYTSIAADPSTLNELVLLIEKFDLNQSSDQNYLKAFWINAYNIAAIKIVVDHYPVKSPYDIPGFFEKIKLNFAGETLSLDQLEKNRIFKRFEDARLHLVLVCAAESCPPIRNSAYFPKTLESELEEQSKKAINQKGFLTTKNGDLELPEFFRWYVHDFGDTKAFISKYTEKQIPQDCKIKYRKYDWTLNDYSAKRSTSLQPYRTSQLMQKGQNELKLFNSIYTQRMKDGFTSFNSRSTYYSMFGQYLHGVNNNLNIGFDLVYRSNLLNDFDRNSAFHAFNFRRYEKYKTYPCSESGSNNLASNSPCHETQGNPESRIDTLRTFDGAAVKTRADFGLSSFGPKFKINPVKKWKSLSWQQTFYIPIKKSVDGNYISFTQLFFDKPIGAKSQLFVEASAWTIVAPNYRNSVFFKIFYSYFPTKRLTLYAMTSIPTEFGVGSKYLISQNLELEVLFTRYTSLGSGSRDIQPSTINFGVRSTW